jgi:ABC-type nitrate/sulfonate/bicarbonate transport system permease component
MSETASTEVAPLRKVGAQGVGRSNARAWLENRWVLRTLSLLVVLGFWELIGRHYPYTASYPTAILHTGIHSSGSQIVPAFETTFESFFLGYGISVVLGIPLGLLMARSRLVELALGPYVSALYATPIIVFIPILIIWLGISFNLRLVAVILLGVFPIILNTYLGAKEVDKNLIDAGIAFKGSELQLLRTVIVPGSLPYIFAGMRLGFSHAMVATVVAEMEATIAGVGAMIKLDSQTLQVAGMWVLIILLGLFNVLGSNVLRAAERWATTPWTRRRMPGWKTQG